MDSDQTEERKILESFVVDNKDLEALESKVSRFNIFEAVGMVRQEIKHSHFIKFLLDPSEKHQLKDLFIKKLLINILSHSQDADLDVLDVSVSDFSDAEVTRELKYIDLLVSDAEDAEVTRELKYIDLLVHSPSNNFVCTIENKVDSSEGYKQLENYSKFIYKKYPQYKKIFIYLTKNGDNASKVTVKLTKNGVASEVPVKWQSLSYATIANIIEIICNDFRTQIDEDIYLSMRHYVDLVRRHIVSESDIAKLCRKIYKQHRQAIDLIYEHRLAFQSELAGYVRKIIADAEEKGVVADRGSKKSFCFAPKEWDDLAFQKNSDDKWKRGNQHERRLLFAFEKVSQSLNLGLNLGLFICPAPTDIRKDIYDKIKSLEITKFQECDNIMNDGGWSVPYRVPILDPADYDDENLEYLKEKIDKFWIDFVSGDLKKIREAIYDSFKS